MCSSDSDCFGEGSPDEEGRRECFWRAVGLVEGDRDGLSFEGKFGVEVFFIAEAFWAFFGLRYSGNSIVLVCDFFSFIFDKECE